MAVLHKTLVIISPGINIILNSEKLNDFSLKSGTKQGWPLLTLSFNIVLQFREQLVKKEK